MAATSGADPFTMQLGALVTGVHYRHPGLPLKTVSTLDVLCSRCDEVGRPYDDIVKTTFGRLGELDMDAARPRFEALAELGVDLAMVDLPDPNDERAFEFLAELVRETEPLGSPTPALLR